MGGSVVLALPGTVRGGTGLLWAVPGVAPLEPRAGQAPLVATLDVPQVVQGVSWVTCAVSAPLAMLASVRVGLMAETEARPAKREDLPGAVASGERPMEVVDAIPLAPVDAEALRTVAAVTARAGVTHPASGVFHGGRTRR
jgi:hypothetical protein